MPEKKRKKRRPNLFFGQNKLMRISLFGTKKPKIAIPDSPPTPKQSQTQPRLAVVLGGGGARGFAHVGVLEVLEKAGIPIDLVVGTSVGSLIGALFCDNQKPHHLKQLIETLKPKAMLDLALLRLRSGLFTGNAIQQFLIKHLNVTHFESLNTPLVVTAVDSTRNELVALETGPIAPAVNASCALPPFFHPVPLYGKTLIDGGIVDPVPADIARHYQPKTIIAVDVSPERVPGRSGNLLSRFVRSYNMSLAELSHLHANDSDVVITPAVNGIDLFDFNQRYVAYEAGFEAAQTQLPLIQQRLNAHENDHH